MHKSELEMLLNLSPELQNLFGRSPIVLMSI